MNQEQVVVKNSLFYLSGLDCPECAKAVEKSIKELPRVWEATLLFSLGKLEVKHDTDSNTIVAVIESHGCRVKPSRNTGQGGFAGQGTNSAGEARQVVLPAGAETGRSAGEVSGRLGGAVKSLGQGGVVNAIVSGAILVVTAVITIFSVTPELFMKIAYTAVIITGGWAIFRQGLRNLARFRFDMNVLMMVAVIGAVFIGEWLEGAIIAFLFALSNTLENYAGEKTRRSVKELMSLAPERATVKRGALNGKGNINDEYVVPIEHVAVGDVVVVRPGERISMDGEVVFGSTWVNEAPITGESLLKEKEVGAGVFAGSINEGGYLEILVTRLAKDNTVAKIIKLVETALAEKPPIQRFIDRFAGFYTPAILTIALGFVTIPPLALGQELDPWLYRALALLLIACPCALVISTPVALVTAMGSSAREGILVKGGLYLEQMAGVKTMAFDKTGTLTKGKPVVSCMQSFAMSEELLLKAAYSLEKMSEHPLARGLCRYAVAKGVAGLPVDSFTVQPGRGVTGRLTLPWGSRQTWIMGSPGFLTAMGVEIAGEAKKLLDSWRAAGEIVVGLGIMKHGRMPAADGINGEAGKPAQGEQVGELAGLFAFRDELRPEAVNALQEIKRLGINLVMLTGDNELVAGRIAGEVGISQVAGQLLPEEKLARIEKLARDGGPVAMVGDGINDAPALAKAAVGIVMGVAGTDAALETADVALMGDDLGKLPLLITISRRTLQIIRQNIVIALGLKLLAVMLIFPGWLTLWLAVVADMGTSLLVTVNGLRLLKMKK